MVTSLLIKLEYAYLLAALVAAVTSVCLWNLRSLEVDQPIRALGLFTAGSGLIVGSLLTAALSGDTVTDSDRLTFISRESSALLALFATIAAAEVAVRIWAGTDETRWPWTLMAASVLIFYVLRLSADPDVSRAVLTNLIQAGILLLAVLRIVLFAVSNDPAFRRLVLLTLTAYAAACLSEVWLIHANHWIFNQGPVELTLPVGLVAMAKLILPLAFTALVVMTLNARNLHALQRRATTDALTNLTARGSLAEEGEGLLGRTRLEGKLVAVLMIDIDHFKMVNDRFGHEVGDRVLAHCARLIRRSLRPEAVVARYGGEEFCAIVPVNSIEDAKVVAERVRMRIQTTPYRRAAAGNVPELPLTVPVTVSVGGTVAHQGEMLEHLLKTADRELYSAKHAGRNRVSLASQPANDEDLLLVV